MQLTRRDAILMGAGAALMAGLPLRATAAVTGDEAIAAFTGGAEVGEGDITLTAPEIAENGNTVPIEVSSDSAVEIMVLALGNPTPAVATFKFGPLAAAREASTRIRLAGTQDVMAIAKLQDGSFVKASSTVKVTIGGCGG
jgi:sulfur-oxidizing protein SoxY